MIGLVDVIKTMEAAIATLEVAMAAEFDQHHAAEQLRAAPGLGPVLRDESLARSVMTPRGSRPPAGSVPSPGPLPSHELLAGPRAFGPAM